MVGKDLTLEFLVKEEVIQKGAQIFVRFQGNKHFATVQEKDEKVCLVSTEWPEVVELTPEGFLVEVARKLNTPEAAKGRTWQSIHLVTSESEGGSLPLRVVRIRYILGLLRPFPIAQINETTVDFTRPLTPQEAIQFEAVCSKLNVAPKVTSTRASIGVTQGFSCSISKIFPATFALEHLGSAALFLTKGGASFAVSCHHILKNLNHVGCCQLSKNSQPEFQENCSEGFWKNEDFGVVRLNELVETENLTKTDKETIEGAIENLRPNTPLRFQGATSGFLVGTFLRLTTCNLRQQKFELVSEQKAGNTTTTVETVTTTRQDYYDAFEISWHSGTPGPGDSGGVYFVLDSENQAIPVAMHAGTNPETSRSVGISLSTMAETFEDYGYELLGW